MKKVKGLRQLFRRKTNNLARLIRIYASILIVALALATLIMVTVFIIIIMKSLRRVYLVWRV